MNIKKVLVGLAATTFIVSLTCAPALASPETLNWGSKVNASQCNQNGSPVINVKETVVNDVDSGVAGNYWAFDNLTRNIQVWPQGNGTYCAVVRYQGEFSAVAGETAPAGTGILDGTENGTFEGGYNGTLTGILLLNPLWPTRGNVGTVDYQCDISGNCPGYIDWVTRYFNQDNLNLNWWGWIYHSGKNGTWVNSIDGNSGNIL